jgi:hypothetical protein
MLCRDDTPACLILDLQMPGLNGLAVQRLVSGTIPIIFIFGRRRCRFGCKGNDWTKTELPDATRFTTRSPRAPLVKCTRN